MEKTQGSLITSFKALEASRIGLLGGTFDPPHNGHLQIAKEVKKKYQLDIVILIPAKKNPLKISGPVASEFHRLKMLELLLAEEKDIFFSDIEIQSLEPSYTYLTLKKIKSQIAKKADLIFILGTDNLFNREGEKSSLLYWKNKAEIFSLAQLVFVARGGFKKQDLAQLELIGYTAEEQQEIENNLVFVNLPVSSTEIRERFYNHDFPTEVLSPKIIEYIRENRLYFS